ncbi:MAG: hypothetical protein QOD84_204 [Acidobacteriaceae bacterium]
MTLSRVDEATARRLPGGPSVAAAHSKYLIILYDGKCGLCNGLVKFVIAHDHADRFRLLPLQSETAARILREHEIDPQSADTMYVELSAPSDRLLSRLDAAIAILRELSGWWRFVSVALRVVPKFLRDWGYSLIARNRYRMFGRHELCMMPSDKDRHKFLDIH